MCCSMTHVLPSGAQRASEAEVQAWSGQGRVAGALCFEFFASDCCCPVNLPCVGCLVEISFNSLWSSCYTCSVLCQCNLYNRQIGRPSVWHTPSGMSLQVCQASKEKKVHVCEQEKQLWSGSGL